MSVNEQDESKPSAAGAGKEPRAPQTKRRRFINRRNAFIGGLALVVGVFGLIVIALFLYRLGFVDSYIASQIKDDFSKYGIRAQIKNFHLTLAPQTVEMQGIELYDSQTGDKLGRVDRMRATIRIQDLYALNLKRHIDLK